ncbi:hypothetical protein [Burkholderia stagnalis]|uniref:hypothetical protein n=1 Tax=Burkholderia stagnalis TaxID=1503054 RepID=UPI000F5A2749|nr:hypothetical protein [Burkholderia stagnalis]
MSSSQQQPLSLLNNNLAMAIANLRAGVQAAASKATSAQETADAAIPKSLAGMGPGDVVMLDANGRLPVVDGSQLINLAAPHGILPVLTIELGHSAQANGGRGIDMGAGIRSIFA